MSDNIRSGQQVITACAFIHQDFDGIEKVFSAKRAGTKKFLPGRWELPGGHIEFGEDIVNGLKREIMEEFNVDLVVDKPFYVFTYMNEVKQTHSIEVIYLARFASGIADIQLNPEDHSEYGWFTREEVIPVISESKPADDPEIEAVIEGFSLLAK